ncbi:MAG: DUF1217 domain-containing protein [Pseudomonadota bacterium]
MKLETEHYRNAISAVTSIDEFVADSRLLRYAMTAFGLEDLAFAKGYVRRILEEGVSDPDSLANRTNDPRISEFARAFDFASFGETTTTRAAAGEDVVNRYVRQTLEVNAEADNGEGVRLALYFERMAPTVTSAFDILADAALAKVVRTVLGLPDEFAAADIEKQAAVIEDRLDLETLSDPEEVNRLLVRFTALWDAVEAPRIDPVLSLFQVGTTETPTISLDLALSVSSFRLGGA